MDVMIDIETLGLLPGSPIAQIGWQLFDPEGDGIDTQDSGSIDVDLDSCGEFGMTMSMDTVRWWMQQDDKARAIFTRSGVSLKHALEILDDMFRTRRPGRVWFKGPQFDGSLLQFCYAHVGREPPWHYRAVRDLRTLTDLFEVQEAEPMVEHDAREDATAQAITAQRALHAAAPAT